jgi:hypothetical protein
MTKQASTKREGFGFSHVGTRQPGSGGLYIVPCLWMRWTWGSAPGVTHDSHFCVRITSFFLSFFLSFVRKIETFLLLSLCMPQ